MKKILLVRDQAGIRDNHVPLVHCEEENQIPLDSGFEIRILKMEQREVDLLDRATALIPGLFNAIQTLIREVVLADRKRSA